MKEEREPRGGGGGGEEWNGTGGKGLAERDGSPLYIGSDGR
jgi:hypothetical protein